MQRGVAGDFSHGQFGEQPHEARHIGIFRIAPELPVIIRRNAIGIEPHGTLRRLAHLRPGCGGDQRCRQAKGFRLIHAPDQIGPHDNIAPLIGPAHLQHHTMATAQFQEVIGLKQHVVEFKEGQRLIAFQPLLHAFHRQHAIDAEMPPDITQEGNVQQLVQPFRVIEHDGIRRAITEGQEGIEYLTNTGLIGFDLRIRKQGPRFIPEGRIAHLCRAAAHQHHGAIAGALHQPQQHDLHQGPDMQAIGSRIKADIAGQRASLQPRQKGAFFGGLVNIAAFPRHMQEIASRAVHDAIRFLETQRCRGLPPTGGRG